MLKGSARLKVTPKRKGSLSSGPILQQTQFWGNLKEYQGFEVRAFNMFLPAEYYRKNGQREIGNRSVVSSDLLVVLQPIGGGLIMAYVPYGPTLEISEEHQGELLEELSEWFRKYLPPECLFVRYDLPWASPWAEDPDRYDDNSEWAGPPRVEIQEIRMNFNTQNSNLHKSPTNALPVNTVFINLKQDKEQILKNMKPKTRYNIRLSQRKGVCVREVDESRLDEWLELCRETAERNHIIIQERHYFETLFAARDSNPDDRTSIHLLMAEAEGKPLAGMFLSISENQATYLYGASSSHQRSKMAPYALQWRAICLAKEYNCRYYDMFGVAPSPSISHPMYGLYRFKTGFGGFLYHRQGCWDYPFQEDLYPIYHAQAFNEEGYHR
jgi:lipid II:glycine glycyltransferase (peptidoglycan interpeptide bridge formation enzyme)